MAYLTQKKKEKEKLQVGSRRILQNVGPWKTTFVRRDANKVAHRLARLGLTLAHPVYWFDEPSDVIFDLLFEDNINC